jgi:hypothetical protein
MDWIEVAGNVLPAIRLDDELRVVSMSPAALRLAGVSREQAQGSTLSELAQREELLAVLPPGWRRSSNLMARHAVFGVLEDTARLYGNAMAWVWLLTPLGRLYRSAVNVVKLEHGFLAYVANVEDHFSCTLVQADQTGKMIDSQGTEWTFETISLFEDFIRGNTLEQMATNHRIPPSRVRAILDDLATSKSYNTAGALRTSAYRCYADEIVPVRQAIFPVMSDELPDFPRSDERRR